MWVSLYCLLHYGHGTPTVSARTLRETNVSFSSSPSAAYLEHTATFTKKQRLQMMLQCIELLSREPLVRMSQIEQVTLDTFEVEGIDEDEFMVKGYPTDVGVHDKRAAQYFKLKSPDFPRIRLKLPISNSVLGTNNAAEDNAEDKPALPIYMYLVEQEALTVDIESKIAEIMSKMEVSRQQHLGVILWQQILYLQKWPHLWEDFINLKARFTQQLKGTLSPTQFVNNNNAHSTYSSPMNHLNLNTFSSMSNHASDSAKRSDDSEQMYEQAHEIQNYVYQACYDVDLLGVTGVQGEKIRESMNKLDVALWNQLMVGAYRLMGETTSQEVRGLHAGLRKNDYSSYTLDDNNYEDSVRSSIMTTPDNHSLVIREYGTSPSSIPVTDEQVKLILLAIYDAADNYLKAHQKSTVSNYYSSLWSDPREAGRVRVTGLRMKIAPLLTSVSNKNLGIMNSNVSQNLSPNEFVEKTRIILSDFFMSKIGERRPGILHDSFIAFLLEELKKVPHVIAILGAEAEAGIKLDEKTQYTAKTPLMKVIREAWRHAFSRLPVPELELAHEKTRASSNIEYK